MMITTENVGVEPMATEQDIAAAAPHYRKVDSELNKGAEVTSENLSWTAQRHTVQLSIVNSNSC